MKFKQLKIFTNKLEEEFKFYTKILGFEVVKKDEKSFTIKEGWSEFTFNSSQESFKYHYCFLIPRNQLNEALEWMERRMNLIKIEDERKIQNFDSWNADSFYFYDASGNIAEFIVRYDLENDAKGGFEISNVLGVNEMGMPTKNVQKLNEQLENELGTKFWKGDINRFGTNGTQEGLWLLPNYTIKDVWFPSEIKIKPHPFEARVEHNGLEFDIAYKKEQLFINPVKINQL